MEVLSLAPTCNFDVQSAIKRPRLSESVRLDGILCYKMLYWHFCICSEIYFLYQCITGYFSGSRSQFFQVFRKTKIPFLNTFEKFFNLSYMATFLTFLNLGITLLNLVLQNLNELLLIYSPFLFYYPFSLFTRTNYLFLLK